MGSPHDTGDGSSLLGGRSTAYGGGDIMEGFGGGGFGVVGSWWFWWRWRLAAVELDRA
jgi:hypothetical protein